MATFRGRGAVGADRPTDGSVAPASAEPALPDEPGEQRSPGELLTRAVRLGSWSVRRAGDLSEVRHLVEAALTAASGTAADGTPESTEKAAPDDAARVSLVVSELAANALKFGSGTATVTVAAHAAGWLVDVHDANLREYPRAQRVDPFRSGQQGLVLVATISPTWGWYVDSWTRRKHVWALVARTSVLA